MEGVRVEKMGERAAWEVRRTGVLVGIVWREARDRYRAAPEGTTKPLARTFPSKEDAVDALVRARR